VTQGETPLSEGSTAVRVLLGVEVTVFELMAVALVVILNEDGVLEDLEDFEDETELDESAALATAVNATKIGTMVDQNMVGSEKE